MRILLFTPQTPYPPRQGATLRNYNIVKHLAQRHTIDLLTFLPPDLSPDLALRRTAAFSGDQPSDHDLATPLRKYCRRIKLLPHPQRTLRQRARDTLLSPLPDMAFRLESAAMRQLVGALLAQTQNETEQYDVVQIEGIEMAQYGRLAASLQAPRPRLIFDDHNCEYLLQKRNCLTDLRHPRRWIAAAYSFVQWQKLRRYEAEICANVSAMSAVSEADRSAIRSLAPNTLCTVIPNGIDLEEFRPAPAPGPADNGAASPLLIFVGKMDYRPNIDAVLWFADKVLPRISVVLPQVCFQIVGMNPHSRLDRLRTQPNIEIIGAVEDVRPYIYAAGVYVIPLRIGGGTRFKALEAMACAKPVVSTSMGVEGLGVQHGEHFILADQPAEFAQAVLALLRNPNSEATGAMCQRACRFVETHYGWERIVPKFDTMYALQDIPGMY